jgi:hypothetical protein
MESVMSKDDLEHAHKRALRDAKRTATNMAEMAYRETFAKTFRDCYAEYMSDDLEKAEE